LCCNDNAWTKAFGLGFAMAPSSNAIGCILDSFLTRVFCSVHKDLEGTRDGSSYPTKVTVW
jgi:hypothetical protein